MAPGRLDTPEDGTWFPCRAQGNPVDWSSQSLPSKIFLHNGTICKFQLLQLQYAIATKEVVYLSVDVETCRRTWS